MRGVLECGQLHGSCWQDGLMEVFERVGEVERERAVRRTAVRTCTLIFEATQRPPYSGLEQV